MHEAILTLHRLGLFMGGAPAFGVLVLAAAAGAVGDGPRPDFGGMAKQLGNVGKAGFLLIIVTGVIMALQSGAFSAGSAWFWVKLVFVLVLLAGIIRGDKMAPAAFDGDAATGAQLMRQGFINIGSLVVIVLCATLAFS